eukprot:scaffold2986_cov249-Pinguiococcus_pyrenoidosus.AAC.11
MKFHVGRREAAEIRDVRKFSRQRTLEWTLFLVRCGCATPRHERRSLLAPASTFRQCAKAPQLRHRQDTFAQHMRLTSKLNTVERGWRCEVS